MHILTEAELRLRLKDEDLTQIKEWTVGEGTKLTPSAREFLTDHKIALVFSNEPPKEVFNMAHTQQHLHTTSPKNVSEQSKDAPSNLPPFVPPQRYETMTGAYYDEKPEHMTALHGTKLVHKSHPVIRFRGQIDSLQARIVEVQLAMRKIGMHKLTEDLEKVLAYTKEILRCEVLHCPLSEQSFLDMSSDEIRARSHQPKQYYGIHHFATSADHGEAVVLLNTLRTRVREVELAAYDAFNDAYGIPQRMDIIQALNRLSSLFYIMMFRVHTKEYSS